MKQILLIILLSVSVLTQGQKALKNESAPEFTLLDKVALKDVFGQIHISFGFCGYSYHLDSNFTFKKTFGCCLGDTVEESGTWRLRDDRILELKSKNGSVSFQVVSMLEYFYYIREAEEDNFIALLGSLTKKYKRTLKRKGPGAASSFLRYRIHSRFFSKLQPDNDI
jgi:hypothetical protein